MLIVLSLQGFGGLICFNENDWVNFLDKFVPLKNFFYHLVTSVVNADLISFLCKIWKRQNVFGTSSRIDIGVE